MSEDMLEPDAVKVARPVLRGAGDSDILPPTRLTEQGVFGDQLRFAAGEISDGAEGWRTGAGLGQA